MAYVDAQNLYSDAQALTATAASTNLIDHNAAGSLGTGEGLAVVVQADVAMAGTSPTLTVSVQTDDNSSFSSPTTIASSAQATALALGGRIIVPIPSGTATERYTRVYYTMGGTTPTATVTTFLSPMSLVGSANQYYPDAISIA